MNYNYQDIINKIRNGEYKLLGFGSCRYVFDMNNGYVVKVAKDIRGTEQNINEYNIFQSQKSGFFAEVVYISENNRLLVMAKAFKIKNINTVLRYYNCRNIKVLVRLDNFIDDINKFGISLGDLARASSWGMVDNTPLMIDYGLTHHTFTKYYGRNLLLRKRYTPIRYW